MPRGLSDEQRKVLAFFGEAWHKNATVCDLGFYKIAVSAEAKDQAFYLWNDNGPVLHISKGFGPNVWGWDAQVGSRRLLLTLADWESKGFVNRLWYRTIDENGNVSGDIVDFDMDGQPDLRVPAHAATGPAQIWWNGIWRDVHHQEKQPGIVDAGQFIEIEFRRGLWRVKE